MFRKDYKLKEWDEKSRALEKLKDSFTELVEGNRSRQGLQPVQEDLEKIFGISFEALMEISNDIFVNELKHRFSCTLESMEHLANILDAMAQQETKNNLAFYQKALILLQYVEKEDINYSLERHGQITWIEQKIQQLYF